MTTTTGPRPQPERPFGPPGRTGCQHAFIYRELGGVAFRCCEGCGQTHLLWQFQGGEMYLLPVPEGDMELWQRVRDEKEREEPEEEVDDDVADLVEDLLDLPEGAGEQPVSPQPDERGRPAQPVQELQEPNKPLRQETGAGQETQP